MINVALRLMRDDDLVFLNFSLKITVRGIGDLEASSRTIIAAHPDHPAEPPHSPRCDRSAVLAITR
jgi:hypothetical protein